MTTITKEFTKEQLIEQAKKNIEVLRGAVERVPGASDAAVIHLKLAEITLASLEAEPVAYIFKHPAGKLFWALTDESNKEQADVIPVYAAPPVPVVPEEKPMPNALSMLEREITQLIGDAQEATVTGYELIAEAWRLMDGQDPKTSDWHSKASKYLNSNRVEKVDDVKPKPVDHGFRDNCECSSCQTTARICSELTDKSSLIYEVNVGGNTWVECTRAAYVRAKDKGELTRVVTNHPNNELKDHQIRELVNELRDIAVQYHGTQQLREKIARAVNNSLKGGQFQPKRIRITHIGDNGVEIPQFSVGDIFDVHGEEFCELHITMPSGHVYWLRAMEKYGDKWEVL
ncbi:hypothetical protein Q2S23_003834 [Escherichia coli]|nr:hypothetical protein [Escherichia coli]EKG0487395.1 hypothetical protein [Escherichia coli]EKL2185007.1 hypothetical protein [Escherichia coli]EKL4135504.1 hypothetical protein [Escherichia coli]EKN2765678.1 hypothetical protein [Escherichia coli]